VPREFT
ncbi:lipase family protein, partial [Vibrio parahaemolyticus V-223/04]